MALDHLKSDKFKHSKMDNLVYTNMEMQAYLMNEDLSLEQKRNLFLCRTRMAEYSENFKAGSNIVTPCVVCKLHQDSLSHAVNCHEILKHINTRGNYSEIFTNNISIETAIMLLEISEVRKRFR